MVVLRSSTLVEPVSALSSPNHQAQKSPGLRPPEAQQPTFDLSPKTEKPLGTKSPWGQVNCWARY